ncbi:MAG: RloB family protein [Syntrophorhabdus sp.]
MAKRAPYDRVLIVCEGEKTEPHYFSWLRMQLVLNRANVVIADKKGGLDPKSLVESAIEEYKKDPDFDHVFCVFDKDKHSTYQGALDKIRSVQLRGRPKIHAINSVPCFEFWLLLHFIYTTRQYDAPLEASNCDLVMAELQEHIPGYEKGSREYLTYVADKTDDAIRNAKQLEEFHQTSGTDNPSTKAYILVEYLMGLKK